MHFFISYNPFRNLKPIASEQDVKKVMEAQAEAEYPLSLMMTKTTQRKAASGWTRRQPPVTRGKANSYTSTYKWCCFHVPRHDEYNEVDYFSSSSSIFEPLVSINFLPRTGAAPSCRGLGPNEHPPTDRSDRSSRSLVSTLCFLATPVSTVDTVPATAQP